MGLGALLHKLRKLGFTSLTSPRCTSRRNELDRGDATAWYRRRNVATIVALVALQTLAGVSSISQTVRDTPSPTYVTIPLTPPAPPKVSFLALRTLPARLAWTEALKLLFSLLLHALLGHARTLRRRAAQHADSDQDTYDLRDRSREDDERGRVRTHDSRRSRRAQRRVYSASGGANDRSMASRGSLLWDADAESGRPITVGEVALLVGSESSSSNEADRRELNGSGSAVYAGRLWVEEFYEGHRSFLSGPAALTLGSSRSTFAITVLALVLAARTFTTFAVSLIAETVEMHLMSSLSTAISALLLALLLGRFLNPVQWHSIALQVCGLFVAQVFRIPATNMQSSAYPLIGMVLYTSGSLVAFEHVMKSHEPSDSTFSIYALLCGAGLLLQIVILLATWFARKASPSDFFGVFSTELFSLTLRAAVEVASATAVIFYDAASFGVITSLSTAILVLYVQWMYGSATYLGLAGTVLATVAFVTYMADYSDVQSQHSQESCKNQRVRALSAAVGLFVVSVYLVIGVLRNSISYSPSAIPSSFPCFADFTFIPPAPPPHRPKCTRKELPSSSFFPGNRTYHGFDDVLLVVFFSHARYDVNLDYYKEVYAEFFPNMVFIGPGNREDLGFAHSYDVIVDSYQSDEDLSDPTYFKMAGRMAHHMLYTVLRNPEYACYAGYLWAPFDTLLNVPRLQLFRQDRFWYHSPFAEFVPNPATEAFLRTSVAHGTSASEEGLGNSPTATWRSYETALANLPPKPNDVPLGEGDGTPEGKARRRKWAMHAPPLLISPDPSVNWTAAYRGWWIDWWWGDPHVGLSVCKRAFERVPRAQRARLATQTNGTRMLGGSADTLYIPGHMRAPFLDVLGLFLDTDCFLEIAVPTAVHLVVPEDEQIQYVDHWWIFRPPFNVTFIRDKWKNGFEVDTFHTFHWGEKGEDGVWRGNRQNIADVRLLLQDSAKRQGLNISFSNASSSATHFYS